MYPPICPELTHRGDACVCVSPNKEYIISMLVVSCGCFCSWVAVVQRFYASSEILNFIVLLYSSLVPISSVIVRENSMVSNLNLNLEQLINFICFWNMISTQYAHGLIGENVILYYFPNDFKYCNKYPVVKLWYSLFLFVRIFSSRELHFSAGQTRLLWWKPSMPISLQ